MCVRSETREIISQRQLQNPPTSSGEVRVDKAWLTDFFQTPLFFKKNFFKYLFTHLAVWGLFDRQDLQPSLQHARSLSCSMWDPVLSHCHWACKLMHLLGGKISYIKIYENALMLWPCNCSPENNSKEKNVIYSLPMLFLLIILKTGRKKPLNIQPCCWISGSATY